ncbi:hypothetical protein [uncultured Vibrio sp.]|uniref:hypothetical protein n=1 Tax=uncultured Vibrio sp. TaxID=114054 RepID=UPI0025F2D957|nr:hypothetical protein [uncultured Vibrio sp.]
MRSGWFNRIMLIASTLCWVLVSVMPVINAHGASAGVWATLCTINGFELVQIEEGKPETQHSKPCPFGHFSPFHHDSLTTAPPLSIHSFDDLECYAPFVHGVRYQLALVRAPPFLLFS